MMKKVISFLLICVLCLSLAVTAFATGDDFKDSVGEGGTPCDHENVVVVNKKDPTCTEDGYTGDHVCEDCGEVIKEGKPISADGHKFENGICRVCGVPDVPKTGDTGNMALWAVLLVVSAAALVTVIGVSRKKA